LKSDLSEAFRWNSLTVKALVLECEVFLIAAGAFARTGRVNCSCLTGYEESVTHSQSAIPAFIGHYRIIERLGKGGMGEVFLAEDTKQHGRKVALKVLPAELTKDEKPPQALKQEARGSAGAEHPNI